MPCYPVLFRPVRRMLIPLLLCLLMMLPVSISRATSQATAGAVDLSFQDALVLDDGTVSTFQVQLDDKVLVGGTFSAVNGVPRHHLARLNADGSLDPGFVTDRGLGVISLLALQSNGKIVAVGQPYASLSQVMVRLNADGSRDPAFDPVTVGGEGIGVMALQADGKVIIAGGIFSIDAVPQRGIARLNPDGTLDATFDPATGEHDRVSVIALQADGKLVIQGTLQDANGVFDGRIIRLNADGSRDATFDGSAVEDNTINVLMPQADGKLLVGGSLWNITDMPAQGIVRLNADGSLDPSFDAGASVTSEVANLALHADGKVIVAHWLDTADSGYRTRIARLQPDGAPDPTFDSSAGVDGWHKALAVQTNGKVMVGSNMRYSDGVRYTNLARLNADGSYDSTFTPLLRSQGDIQVITIQADGKLIIGGSFSYVQGVDRRNLARLNADGSLDPTFDPGSGPNEFVAAISVQADGKLIVGGFFTSVNGVERPGLARLNADGSLDSSFATDITAAGYGNSLALQADGKVIVGGSFSASNDVGSAGIVRLNADGSLDPSFATSTSADWSVYKLVLQADGKVIAGKRFYDAGGVYHETLVRLNPDGSLDPSVDIPLGAYSQLNELVLQADGKVIGGGWRLDENGVSHAYLKRLNADGSLDPTFTPDIDMLDMTSALAVQADGKLVVAWGLYDANGVYREGLGRLNADGSLDPTFDPGTGVDGWLVELARQADGKVLIAGAFTTINGVARTSIARLDMASEGPRLFVSPATSTIDLDQVFELELHVDTAGQVADTVDAYLTFDPALLEVVDAAGNPATSITPNPDVVGSVTYNHVNPITGQIDVSASQYASPYLTGSTTVAMVRFRAEAPAAQTTVELARSGIRQSDLFLGGNSLQTTHGHATVEIANDPLLCGRIAIEQRGPVDSPRWITPLFRTEGSTTTGGITLYQPGPTNEFGRFAATTDESGRFCVTATDVPAGTYDVRVKGANTLSHQRTNVDLRTATEIAFGTLRVGDSTGDDRVTGADVSALMPNFLRSGAIAVSGSGQAEPKDVRVQTSTRPQVVLTPAQQQVQVGAIVPI